MTWLSQQQRYEKVATTYICRLCLPISTQFLRFLPHIPVFDDADGGGDDDDMCIAFHSLRRRRAIHMWSVEGEGRRRVSASLVRCSYLRRRVRRRRRRREHSVKTNFPPFSAVLQGKAGTRLVVPLVTFPHGPQRWKESRKGGSDHPCNF